MTPNEVDEGGIAHDNLITQPKSEVDLSRLVAWVAGGVLALGVFAGSALGQRPQLPSLNSLHFKAPEFPQPGTAVADRRYSERCNVNSRVYMASVFAWGLRQVSSRTFKN